MSSFNSATIHPTNSTTTTTTHPTPTTANTEHWQRQQFHQQQQPPHSPPPSSAPHHHYPYPYQQPHQQQHQQPHQPPHYNNHHQHLPPDSHPRQNMFEMQTSSSSSLPQSAAKSLMARIDGEDEELEVIGSGISGSFEPLPTKPRLSMKLPNLKYNYPEASVQNFSPGTSLIFNAYRGYSGLLTQPYSSTIENTNEPAQERIYQRIRSPLSQEAQSKYRPRQCLTYKPNEADNYSQYPQNQHQQPQQQHHLHQHQHQRPVEHEPYHAPQEQQYPPYQENGSARDLRHSRDHLDSRHPREYGDPTDYERSPGLSSSTAASRTSPRVEQGHDSRARIQDHLDHHRPRDNYPPQPLSMPPPPPPQPILSDAGLSIPQSYPIPPTSQHWRRPNSDYSSAHQHHPHYHHPYEGSGSSGNSNRYIPQQPSAQQQRTQGEPWDVSSHRSYQPSAAIDIPQPRNRGTASYPDSFDLHDPADSNIRSHHQSHQQQAHHPGPGNLMGSTGFRGPFNQRPMGPRYALSRVNYRMIFEYASEIRECLIKGKVGSTDRLLYNAEILSKVFMGCRADIDPNSPSEEETAVNPHQLRCTSCNIVKTPEWRKGPLGPRTLCNACGLIWGKMSRSKAALVAKSKQELITAKTEPSTTTITPVATFSSDNTTSSGDTHMADATPEGLGGEGSAEISTSSESSVTLINGSRKRGRDIASVMDADEAETLARDDDKKTIEASRREVEALHLSSMGSMDLNNDNSNQQPLEDSVLHDSEKNSAPHDPSSLDGDSLNQGPDEEGLQLQQPEDSPAGGRKLALSFLLV